MTQPNMPIESPYRNQIQTGSSMYPPASAPLIPMQGGTSHMNGGGGGSDDSVSKWAPLAAAAAVAGVAGFTMYQKVKGVEDQVAVVNSTMPKLVDNMTNPVVSKTTNKTLADLKKSTIEYKKRTDETLRELLDEIDTLKADNDFLMEVIKYNVDNGVLKVEVKSQKTKYRPAYDDRDYGRRDYRGSDRESGRESGEDRSRRRRDDYPRKERHRESGEDRSDNEPRVSFRDSFRERAPKRDSSRERESFRSRHERDRVHERDRDRVPERERKPRREAESEDNRDEDEVDFAKELANANAVRPEGE